MRTIAAVVTILFAACGSDEEPPSCQQGVGAYYDAGCWFEDIDGNRFAENEVVSFCREILVYPECKRDLDRWLLCLESVDPDTCDCSVEQEALIGC